MQSSSQDTYKWRAFWTVSVALVVIVMDLAVTIMALPTIADDFRVTLRPVTWVAIASSLTISAMLLPLGRVSDLTGRKRFHVIGLIFFVGGQLMAASAPSLGLLIGARVIAALGAAMGQAVVMAIITAVFPAHERGKGLGMMTTAVALGATAGPLVAGPMLQFFGWRWLFVLLAIPATVAIVFAVRVLDDTRIGTTKVGDAATYDWAGAIFVASALALAIITISNPFGLSWGSPLVVGGAVLALLLFVALVWWELRCASPLLNLRFFRNATFAFSTLTRLLGFVGSSAAFFLMPLFIQSFLGYEQLITGLIMFAGALGIGTAGFFSGRLSDRYGFRLFTFAGLATLVGTTFAFAFLGTSTPVWAIVPLLFINGVAMGTWMAPNINATLSVVERRDYGAVSAFLHLVRNAGNVTCQALTTAIIAGVMAARGVEIQLSQLAANASGPAGMAFIDGWRVAYFILTGFVLAALAAAILTRPGSSITHADLQPRPATIP